MINDKIWLKERLAEDEKSRGLRRKRMADIFIHIGEMLARNGRMYPDEVALVERDPKGKRRLEITWKEFDRKADRMANFLRERGIGKGDKVVHLMHNSIDWLAAYFGIIRTGAWVVPLNFRFTSEDIRYCIDVAEPRIVLFGEEFTERIDSIRDELSSVETFICAGEHIPAYAESFSAALGNSPDEPLSPGYRTG